jgi:hypothetical protein
VATENDALPQFPFERGPYLLVALPLGLGNYIPLNTTRFLEEWLKLIDPVDALRSRRVLGWLRFDWVVSGNFTEAGFHASHHLREAARDDVIRGAFDESRVHLHEGEEGPATEVRTMIGDNGLTNQALPILLGLAVISTADVRAGHAGVWLAEQFAKYYELQEERVRSRAERLTEGLRSDLEEFGPEAFGREPD